MTESCTIPPEGWRCTRTRGHDGPCAAVPDKEMDDAASDAVSDAVDLLEDTLRELEKRGYRFSDLKLAALELLM